ncbi:MAG: cytochrome c biogenesis protein CcsA, partial [bacterium]
AECISRRALVGFPASGLGFVLMVAISFFPLNMTRIEPLRAVLNSSWLTYHVSSMLLSYSAFMMSFLFAFLYLLKHFTGPRLGWLPSKDLFDQFNYRAVQVGWPLITFGIFAGGIWANTAWGRFWSWDPKETWALITWLIYTIYLHLRLNQGWRGSKAAWTTVIGFVCVLMTWYGVSYLKIFAGGLHSYA